MARRRDTSEHSTKKAKPGGPPAQFDEHRGETGSGGGNTAGGRRGSWFQANKRDLKFLLIFAVCMGLYYLSTLTPPVRDGFFPAYLRLNAAVSGVVLRIIGEDVTVRDQEIVSEDGPSIQVERGCDAIEPSALFVSAVLASPVSWSARLSAAALGTIALMVLNLVRVASLFLVRVYFPQAFDTVHLDVWQALFIFLAIVLWATWASQASRRRVARSDVST